MDLAYFFPFCIDFTYEKDTGTNGAAVSQYIRQLMIGRGLTSAGLIAQAGLHRTYGNQILTGTRVPSKAKVMQLALAMKLDLHDTQNLLALSNNGGLYPRIREDAIYIHCLLHHKTVMECSMLLCEHGLEPLG